MTWDYEHAYPGGPMVKVPGFPRPCYPPDAAAHGKTPSVDGPDIVAYKRTVSRAGRWPWQTFDEAFSNGFSHGKSGNVAETGVAGIQRQQHLDATGWIGEKTFNTLRSIRIPEGLPHAGEPAMDAAAVNLIGDAWELFAGSEPPPDPAGSLRAAALDQAIGELGMKESPPESNHQPYGVWYGMDGVPWCAIFVSWCFEQAGDARNRRNGLQTTDDPIPGDLVVYDWGGDAIYDHIGIFERWTSGTSQFNAIEGNTSASNNSNGGEVMRRSRSRGGQGTVFVRVAEP
jgi:CHAP domain